MHLIAAGDVKCVEEWCGVHLSEGSGQVRGQIPELAPISIDRVDVVRDWVARQLDDG